MSRSRLFLSVISVTAAGCPAPASPVKEGRGMPAPSSQTSSQSPGARAEASAPSGAARVHVMREGEQLGGPNAIGRPGDLLLENDAVVFVVDRLGSSSGFAESGGNLVDAADARARKDELGQVFTYFGKFPRQGVYETLASGAGPGGRAWVEAKGHELYERNLVVTTRYTLAPAERELGLETVVENTGPTAVDLPALGDAIEWGGAEKFAPGEPNGFRGESNGPYVGGVGRFVSYAVKPIDGAIRATSGGSWTDTSVAQAVHLAPGQKTKYARSLIVGERPDSTSVVAELMRAATQPTQTVNVSLIEPSRGGVDIPADARLVVKDATGADAMSIHAAGDPPRLIAALPIGHWVLSYVGGGGRAGVAPTEVDVSRTSAAAVSIGVTPASRVRVDCAAADGARMPCKVTFERTDGGPRPDFGVDYAAGPARYQVTTADGKVDVAVSPGAYRVTASRGPEYALSAADVTLEPRQEKELTLSPRRVVDTSGYIACDFHQHTVLGTDSPVATRDRVIANAAEGVKVAVASEHNVVANFAPLVRELNLERDFVSIPGDEITTDASRHPWGHENAWPMAFDPNRPRGGAPPVRDRTPREVLRDLQRGAGDFVLQVNHPRSGSTGYFDLLGLNPATGLGTDPAYDSHFDALEVWNGRNVEARTKVLQDFFLLLRSGHAVTATADTDTHGIVGHEAGYPRTYVRVTDDGHLDAWDAARTQELVRGVKTLRDVVLTNGPFLRVAANGAPIGGILRSIRSGRVDVKVHVESAPWVVVDEIRLVLASGDPAPNPVPVQEKPTARGGLAADVMLTLSARADDAFVVIATGRRSMSPILAQSQSAGARSPTAIDPETLPWAMTGAIWIDGDGQAGALGR